MATIYENRDFLADLDSDGRAIRSAVYCGRIATVWVFEWMRSGMLKEFQKHYPVEQIPERSLKDKFRRLSS